MKITKIEVQKKNPGRYSLYVDEAFWLGINERVLLKFALFKGQSLDQALMDQITAYEVESKLYQKALNYLSFRMRSKQEMTTYLKKQAKVLDLPHQACDHLVTQLESEGLLNDQVFAQMYLDDAQHLNAKGPKLIEQDLRQKGVQAEIINHVLENYSEDQALANAHTLLDKYLRTKSKLSLQAAKDKAYQHLYQKGFTRDTIKKLLAEFDFQAYLEDQDKVLAHQANKLLAKYQKKAQGYDLKQKLYLALRRKGFDNDRINDWLAQTPIFENDIKDIR